MSSEKPSKVEVGQRWDAGGGVTGVIERVDTRARFLWTGVLGNTWRNSWPFGDVLKSHLVYLGTEPATPVKPAGDHRKCILGMCYVTGETDRFSRCIDDVHLVPASPAATPPKVSPKLVRPPLLEVSPNGRDWVNYDSLADSDPFMDYDHKRINGKVLLTSTEEKAWKASHRIVGKYHHNKTENNWPSPRSEFQRMKPAQAWQPSDPDADIPNWTGR